MGSMRQKRHRISSWNPQVFDSKSIIVHSAKTNALPFIYATVFALFLSMLGCHTLRSSPEPSESEGRAGVGPHAAVTLRVATSGDYPPFSDWPPNSPAPVGFSISVAEAYALDSGLHLEWVRFRWPELADDLAAGSFDFAISGITVRPDRSMRGRFGIPLTSSSALVLVAAESSIESAKDLDRASIRIAVNAGGHLEKVAKRLFPSARIEAIPDNKAVLGALLEGEVDAVVTDSLEAPLWQRDAGLDLRSIGPLTRDHKAAWFPPENAFEVRRFDRWLLAAESSGQLARLRNAHGLAQERTARPLPALLSSLNERLSLMKSVAEAKRILGLPIENLQREEVVLDAAGRAIREAAEETHSEAPDPRVIRRLFRAQIEAAKWIQSHHLMQTPVVQKTTGSTSSRRKNRARARTRLDEVIRPALLDLGHRISMLILACAAEAPIELSEDQVARALAGFGLPEAQLREIYAALSEIVTRERVGEPMRRSSPARRDRSPSASRRTTPP